MKVIETERLILRPFKIEDADDCLEYLSDKETCYIDGGYEPFTKEDPRFNKLMELFLSQNSRYMIELKSESKVIGTIYIRNAVFRVVLACEIGYCLSPNYRRCGYMSEALKSIFHLLFEEESIQLILAKAYEQNIPSIELLKSLGFQYEGKLIDSFRYPGVGIGALECFYLRKEDYLND